MVLTFDAAVFRSRLGFCEELAANQRILDLGLAIKFFMAPTHSTQKSTQAPGEGQSGAGAEGRGVGRMGEHAKSMAGRGGGFFPGTV